MPPKPTEPQPSRFPSVPPPPSRFFPALREVCLSRPGAWEDYPWGETVYKAGKKIFASFHQPEGGDLRVGLKATLEDQAALVLMPGIERAAYIGRHGWITATVSDEASFELVRDLTLASYALVKNPPT